MNRRSTPQHSNPPTKSPPIRPCRGRALPLTAIRRIVRDQADRLLTLAMSLNTADRPADALCCGALAWSLDPDYPRAHLFYRMMGTPPPIKRKLRPARRR